MARTRFLPVQLILGAIPALAGLLLMPAAAQARPAIGATPAASLCSGQLIGNPGFETGTAAPWSASFGVVSNSTREPAHTGSWDAWLGGYGYANTEILSQTVQVPAGCHATLSYWLHIDTAETTTTTAYDTMTVKLNSTLLHTYSNLDHNTGFAFHSVNLPSGTDTITFTATEDSSLQTSFVLDDITVTSS